MTNFFLQHVVCSMSLRFYSRRQISTQEMRLCSVLAGDGQVRINVLKQKCLCSSLSAHHSSYSIGSKARKPRL